MIFSDPTQILRANRRHWLQQVLRTTAILPLLPWMSGCDSGEDSDIPTASALDRYFWPATFPTPTGQAVALREFQGRPLLINFWASWCPPCVQELPLLESFHQKQQALSSSSHQWRVLGIAVDSPREVKDFLSKHPVTYPIVVAPQEGSGMMKALGNNVSGLPYSVFVDASGHVLFTKAGELDEEDLLQRTQSTANG